MELYGGLPCNEGQLVPKYTQEAQRYCSCSAGLLGGSLFSPMPIERQVVVPNFARITARSYGEKESLVTTISVSACNIPGIHNTVSTAADGAAIHTVQH